MLGWRLGFLPLPAPVRPPLALFHPRWVPWRFHPPGATLPLRGCQCPAATRPPLPLPGGPLRGFPPLQRLRGPPLGFLLLMTRRTGFTAGQRPSPFPPLPAPWRPPAPASAASLEVASAVAPCHTLRPLDRLSHRLPPIPLPLPSAKFRPPPPPPPAVSASSSDADSSVYSHPHLALSSALSSVPLLPPFSIVSPSRWWVLC